MSVWQSLVQVTDPKDVPIHRAPNLLSQTSLSLDEQKQIYVHSDTRKCFDLQTGQSFSHFPTGDLGQVKGESLYFVGRMSSNDQLKINGRRTSLREIQVAVEKVVSSPCRCISDPQSQFVVAFVLKRAKEEEASIMLEKCLRALPTHLVPSQIKVVSDFKMTLNGKFESQRKKLFPSCQELEKSWVRYTGKEPTDKSSFIEDGGNSITAVMFLNEFDISPRGFLDKILNGTFGDLCNFKEEGSSSIALNSDQKTSSKTQELRSDFDFAVKGRVSQGYQNKIEQLSFSPRLEWSVNLGKCIDASPLVICDNKGAVRVYIGSHSGLFACIDIKEGSVTWQQQLPHRIEGTAGTNGRFVFVGCFDGLMYCLDAVTGNQAWTFTTGDVIKSQPVAFEDKVVFGSYDHCLYCVSSETGHLKWKVEVGASILATPLVIPNSCDILVATLSGQVIRIADSTLSAEVKWELNVGGPVFHGLAIVNDGSLAVVTNVRGFVSLLDLNNGSELSRLPLNSPTFSGITPTSSGGAIFGTHHSSVVRFEEDRIKWSCKVDGEVFATPFPIHINGQESVTCLTTKGTLYFIRSQDGTITQSFQISKNTFSSSPVVWQNRVLFGSRDDSIECFEV